MGAKPPADSQTLAAAASSSSSASMAPSSVSRVTLASTPSTTNWRARRMKGSFTSPSLPSSASTPSRRATEAYSTSDLAMPTRSRFFSVKASLTSLMPWMKSFLGKATMTAPMVPPKTIMAAVSWRMEPTWPPSSRCPTRIMATAKMMPPMLVMSIDYSFGPGTLRGNGRTSPLRSGPQKQR